MPSLTLNANTSEMNFTTAQNFGVSIPVGAVILGIQLTVNGSQTTSGGLVYFTANGDGTTTTKIVSLPLSTGNLIIGSSADLWGGLWESSYFTNSNFNFTVAASNPTNSSITFTINSAQVQIFYEIPATTQCEVSVLLDEICGTFENLPLSVNDPPQLAPSSSVLSNRFYLSQGSTPPMCRHLQIKLNGSAAPSKDEILAVTIRGALEAEQT